MRLLDLELGGDLLFPEPLPIASGDFFPSGPELEGGEELHVFAGDLCPQTEDGPVCPRPLPPPLGSSRADSQGTSPGEPSARLAAGSWTFAQARPRDAAELADFVEAFMRDLWWEGRGAEGPLYLRVVREDGRTAYQLWRRKPAG